MKLAEALVQRKALMQHIEECQDAIIVAAVADEGTRPDEDPEALRADLDRLRLELQTLIVRIHRTNLASCLEAGESLTEAIARRDSLVARHRFTKSLLERVLKRNQRESWERGDGQRLAAILAVKDLRQAQSQLGKELRVLDTSLQKANWSVDLMD